ncbi:hypothetical protein [Pseudomonas silesiensis]|uniref:hypothetical protein n=1 Tax=Pseudomonas silesiensis TaxID=1853130 RepID=UPI0030D80B84
MTTPTAIPAHNTGEERSKRIFAIVGGSSGNRQFLHLHQRPPAEADEIFAQRSLIFYPWA